MVDPRSETDPSTVLDRWSDYINVDVWTDPDVFSPEELQNRAKVEDMVALHRSRHSPSAIAGRKRPRSKTWLRTKIIKQGNGMRLINNKRSASTPRVPTMGMDNFVL